MATVPGSPRSAAEAAGRLAATRRSTRRARQGRRSLSSQVALPVRRSILAPKVRRTSPRECFQLNFKMKTGVAGGFKKKRKRETRKKRKDKAVKFLTPAFGQICLSFWGTVRALAFGKDVATWRCEHRCRTRPAVGRLRASRLLSA